MSGNNHPMVPLAERLWRRVEKLPSGCWEWTGCRYPSGYGQIGRGRSSEGLVSTHIAAWEVTNGPIPKGLYVCHRCDNPPCCNPDHLFLGTAQQNVDDMIAKGRIARGARLPHTKLTDEQVRALRAEYNPRFGPPKRGGRSSNADLLAEKYGITRQYVMQLAYGWYRRSVQP